MHQSKGDVKVLACGKGSMMRPNSHIILFHKLTGSHRDIPAAGNHPGHNADTGREYDRTFRCHFPELSCKYLILQRQYKGEGNHIHRMGMIDYPVCTVCCDFLYFMVHQVGRELAGWLSAVY